MAKRVWDSIDEQAERHATACIRHSIAQPKRTYGRRTHKQRKAAIDGLYVVQRKMIKENYERF